MYQLKIKAEQNNLRGRNNNRNKKKIISERRSKGRVHSLKRLIKIDKKNEKAKITNRS